MIIIIVGTKNVFPLQGFVLSKIMCVEVIWNWRAPYNLIQTTFIEWTLVEKVLYALQMEAILTLNIMLAERGEGEKNDSKFQPLGLPWQSTG